MESMNIEGTVVGPGEPPTSSRSRRHHNGDMDLACS